MLQGMNHSNNDDCLTDGDLAAEESLNKARADGNPLPPVSIGSEANNRKDAISATTISGSTSWKPTRPGAYGCTPGKDHESFRIKGILSDPAVAAMKLNTDKDEETTAAVPKVNTDLHQHHLLSPSSPNVHEMHKISRARREMKKNQDHAPNSIDSMHQRARERRLAGKISASPGSSKIDEPDNEIIHNNDDDRNPSEVLKRIADPLDDVDESSRKLMTSGTIGMSISNLAIAAEVVDDEPPIDFEAQIQERMGQYREKLMRDAVQADAVKVIPEDDDRVLAPAPTLLQCGWKIIASLVVLIIIGVTLGVVLPRSLHNDSQVGPATQAPSKLECTLCPNGSMAIQYRNRQIPRQPNEGFSKTCGSLASDPMFVAALLEGGSGDCYMDVQVYANYCGCPSASTETRSSGCSFCPLGLNPPNALRTTPVYNDTCSDLSTFIASVSSSQCVDSTSVLNVKASGTFCQCANVRDIPKQYCELCPIVGDEPQFVQNNASRYNMSCDDLNGYASLLTETECGTNQNDLVLSAGVCGCPPLNCSLCPSASILYPSMVSLFRNYSCAELDGFIGSLTSDACLAYSTIIEENKGHCQCFYPPVSAPVAAEPNPAFFPSISPYPSTIWESTFKTQEPSSFLCSLCPGGESLPDPNQLVPSGDGTCGELSTIVSSFTSQSCQEQQAALNAIAVACGCPNA